MKRRSASPRKNAGPCAQVYGPVPSRRLGFSLGVDILPAKICTFDCVYCQLGRTPKKAQRRRKYFPAGEILSQIKKAIARGGRIDYITFSGSGEPTLNADVGELIRKVKRVTSIPVAVLTNSSLLSRKAVRRALLAADLVVPSLDAATPRAFRKVNRPHPSLRLENIMAGLREFRKEYRGRIWLEVMLVKGINDSPADIRALKEAVARINPDKVQLNTVIRPPAEEWARPLTRKELETIRDELAGHAEVIVDFGERRRPPSRQNVGEALLSMIRRRPVTLQDLAGTLGLDKSEVLRHLKILLGQGKIQQETHKKTSYYKWR